MSYRSLLIWNVVISVLVPLAVSFWLYALKPPEVITLALLLWLVLMTLEALYYVHEVHREHGRRIREWQVQTKIDEELRGLRDNIISIVDAQESSHDRLFEDLVRKDLHELSELVRLAAHAKRISVKDHHFDSHERLADIFRDSNVSLYREVFILDQDCGTFDYIYVNFFRMLATIASKNGVEIRTLLIRTHQGAYENEACVQWLLSFYESTAGFAKKAIGQKKFAELRQELKVGTDWTDFGVYGDRVLFLTHRYSLGTVTDGVFSKEPNEIDRFIRFFDKAWEAGVEVHPKTLSKVSLDDMDQYCK